MFRIWFYFVSRPTLSYLLLVALVLFGLFSAVTLQRESAPEVEVPVAIVTSALSGATPEDIELLITNKLEQAVLNIDNVKKVTSSSREGFASVVIEFDATADLAPSLQDVKDEVDKVRSELPEDATDPLVSDINFSDQPIMLLAVSSDRAARSFLDFMEAVEKELENIPGVSRAETSGVRERELVAVVRKEALALHNLTLPDVISQIRASDVALPLGSLVIGEVSYPLAFDGTIDEIEDMRRITITTPTGSVLLGDIAELYDGLSDATTLSRVSEAGEPSRQAGVLSVFKQSGADITDISRAVDGVLAGLEERYPEVTFAKTYDAGEDIARDLGNLLMTALQTIALVMLTIFISLGTREALIAGFSIPLTFLCAFIGLSLSGNTLNFISLFSLILAIGILVDSAVVMTEAISVNLARGMKRIEAARQALRQFHFPLTAGTMTTVAVFVPLFTISGITGEFISAIPFTVLFVLLASLIVALTFIPLFASTFLAERQALEERVQDAYVHRLGKWYERHLRRALASRTFKRRFIWGLGASFFLALALPVAGLLKVEFFPQSDVPFIYVEIEKPVGTRLAETDLAARAVEEVFYGDKRIKSFTTTVGAQSSFNQSAQGGERFANITITLVDANEREETSSELLQEFEKRIAAFDDFSVRVFQLNDGPPVGTPIVVKFFGEDLHTLESLAAEARTILASMEGTREVVASGEDNASEFTLAIDRARAAELGLSPLFIAQTLRAAVFGTEATTIRSQGEDIDVIVKLNLNTAYLSPHETNEATLDALLELPVATPKGQVLLGSVLRPSLGNSRQVIAHEEGERLASVSSQLAPGGNVATISREFKERAAQEFALPDGVRMIVGGETEETDQAFQDTFRALLVGLVLILAILVIEFNSYRQAAMVLAVVPLSLIGVLCGLFLIQSAVSFPSMLGFIALAGIVVNNAIILIDVYNTLQQEEPTRPLREVVVEGSLSRLRPVLLTTLTTVMGMIPLLFASDLWRPIAVAIIFGLLFATLLTLLLVPMLYLKWGRIT